MSLLFKKILEKIKDLDAKEKTTELDVTNLLQNSWEEQYLNQIFKKDNLVYVNLAVKNGTTTKILTLPERLQTF